MGQPTFSILITTKDRKNDLVFTLDQISYLLEDASVECVVFDDGSIDGTFEYVQFRFPNIKVRRNTISKGYISCRNKMLNDTKADFAISLDDDAHFVTKHPLEAIKKHFDNNGDCGLIALRIFWGLQEPSSIVSNEQPRQVKGFVGCAHVWRMKVWRDIPNYPEWFVFYGEEDFASYQLFKKNWSVNYLPEVLVNHRVDLKLRRNNADYAVRLRRSLHSGWYVFFLFYPFQFIPRKMIYSLWTQFNLKVFKGDFRALQSIVLALLDLIWAIPTIIKNSNRLSSKEYAVYNQLPETKIYWQPEK